MLFFLLCVALYEAGVVFPLHGKFGGDEGCVERGTVMEGYMVSPCFMLFDLHDKKKK